MTGWLGGLALSKAMFSILISSVLHAASLWQHMHSVDLSVLCALAWHGVRCVRVPASEIKFIEAPLAVPLTRTVPSP